MTDKIEKDLNEVYFDSFCTRMWLDYCDENNDPISAQTRMDRDEYVERWHEWLLEKWQNRDLKDG
tara:strand:+ start:694 stop:888 length:195 start_codon:yes stop_codon:yes gene_type:complete